MKKHQIPGTPLNKEQQRQVLGGLLLDKKATCVCWDDTLQHPCAPTCSEAQGQCENYCEAHGGYIEILFTCSDC